MKEVRKGSITVFTLLIGFLILLFAGCSQGKPTPAQPGGGSPGQQPEAVAQAPSGGEKPVGGTKSPEVTKINLAIPAPSVSFLPFQVAKEAGFFAQEGIDAELTIMTADKAVAAMISGDVDYTGAIGSTMRAAAQGMPVKAIMGLAIRPTHTLTTVADIKKVEQLKGKTIGESAPGASDTLVATLVLRELGLELDKDVKMLFVGAPPQRLAAMQQNVIQASMMEPPMIFSMEKQGFNLLVDAASVIDEPITGLGTSEKKIKEQPEEVKKVIRALLGALEYMREDREGTAKILGAWLKVDEEVALKSYDKVKGVWSPDGSITEKGLGFELQLAKEILKLDKDIDKQQVVDFDLLNEVQSELGIKK